MSILWLNLSIVFVLAYFARLTATLNLTNSVIQIKPNPILAFLALLPLIVVSGLRRNIGDTYFYMHAYEVNEFTLASIMSHGKDIGFGILQMLLKYVSEDPQVLIFTAALITNVLIILVLYKYSRLFEISLYVYITGGMFLVSMNGLRQFLAASIIFVATKYLIEGNGFKYFLIIILASTIHQSALILIPIYFIARFKAWSKATVALICSAVIIVIGFEQFSVLLFNAIEDTQYGYYADFQEGGANIIRVIVYAAPIIIAFLGREKLRELNKHSDVIVNMSILGLVFMIISTQNWIFARFIIYFGLYQIIIVSWIVKLFAKKDQKLIYYGILAFYFLYYFYESVISLNIIYGSDYLTW